MGVVEDTQGALVKYEDYHKLLKNLQKAYRSGKKAGKREGYREAIVKY